MSAKELQAQHQVQEQCYRRRFGARASDLLGVEEGGEPQNHSSRLRGAVALKNIYIYVCICRRMLLKWVLGFGWYGKLE